MQKAFHSRRLLEIAYAVSPFRSPNGQLCAAVPLGAAGHHVMPLHSAAFRDWLIDAFVRQAEMPPTYMAIASVLRTLEARALFGEMPPRLSNIRLGCSGDPLQPDALVLDLAAGDKEIVKISPGGWELAPALGSLFQFSRTALPLPRPVAPASAAAILEKLQALLNIPEGPAFNRCIAWLIAALKPAGPYPVLVLSGPPASGKSTAARMLRGLIDPSTAPTVPLPVSESTVNALALHNRVLAFDNVSAIPRRIADSLCRIATGAAIRVKTAAPDEPVYAAVDRPMILALSHDAELTHIAPADLVDRSLRVDLAGIAPRQRCREAVLAGAYRDLRPEILGALCSAASAALAGCESVEIAEPHRLADTVAWIAAAAPALAIDPQSLLTSIARPADPVTVALDKFMAEREEWTGTAAELLNSLQFPPYAVIPGNARALSSLLQRMSCGGIAMHFRRSHGVGEIHLVKRGAANASQAPVFAAPDADRKPQAGQSKAQKERTQVSS